MRDSRSGRSTPAWMRCPSQPLPGRLAVRPGRRRAARRQGRLESGRGVPRRRVRRAVTDGNGAVLVALTEGVSALVLRVRRTRRSRASRIGPPSRRRLPRPRSSRYSRRRYGFHCRRRCGAAAVGRPWTTTGGTGFRSTSAWNCATAPLSDRSAPDIADVAATAAKVTGFDGGVRAITVDGRRSTTGAPARHGSGSSRRRGRRLQGLRREAGSSRGRVATDQFPGGRRRRPVHDGRENSGRRAKLWARVAEVAGEPDAGAARRMRSPPCP